jgi:hypothetical protein
VAGSAEAVAKHVQATPPAPHLYLEEVALTGKLTELKDDGNPNAD